MTSVADWSICTQPHCQLVSSVQFSGTDGTPCRRKQYSVCASSKPDTGRKTGLSIWPPTDIRRPWCYLCSEWQHVVTCVAQFTRGNGSIASTLYINPNITAPAGCISDCLQDSCHDRLMIVVLCVHYNFVFS